MMIGLAEMVSLIQLICRKRTAQRMAPVNSAPLLSLFDNRCISVFGEVLSPLHGVRILSDLE